jgi:hypothetical protein
MGGNTLSDRGVDGMKRLRADSFLLSWVIFIKLCKFLVFPNSPQL